MNLFSPVRTRTPGSRDDAGFLPLAEYGVIGDGRSIAICGADGSIDWWCVPTMDSPPLFDRLLDPDGGRFSITPVEPFEAHQHYRPDSNVLETVFTTTTGRAKLVESLNSGSAGRMPWTELARRVEGLDGHVRFRVEVRFSTRVDTISPFISPVGERQVFHAEHVLGVVVRSSGVEIEQEDDTGLCATLSVGPGDRELVAMVTGHDEPLMVPDAATIDERIDTSDQEWRTWAGRIRVEGRFREMLVRSAMALKLLLYSPSGAIIAAATTSLPERIGGDKNYDYRFAWVRDAGYTIKAFLDIGALAEAKAAIGWLIDRIAAHGPQVLYKLGGDLVDGEEQLDIPGYRGSRPVLSGNRASGQLQLGVFGDILETAARFAECGGILDSRSASTLARVANRCADVWRQKDSGIWELPEPQHFTMSKISAWQALDRAVRLADAGQLPTDARDRWSRERERIAAWVDEHCWSEARGAYVLHAGSDRLDASLALAMRCRFDRDDRLRRTLEAVDRELGAGPFHYRYSGAQAEEGCFLACTFWMAEAWAHLGENERAERGLRAATDALSRGPGVLPEQVDPDSGDYLGNLPQGLTHLALIQAVCTIEQPRKPAPERR